LTEGEQHKNAEKDGLANQARVIFNMNASDNSAYVKTILLMDCTSQHKITSARAKKTGEIYKFDNFLFGLFLN